MCVCVWGGGRVPEPVPHCFVIYACISNTIDEPQTKNHDSITRVYLTLPGCTYSACTCTDVHQPALLARICRRREAAFRPTPHKHHRRRCARTRKRRDASLSVYLALSPLAYYVLVSREAETPTRTPTGATFVDAVDNLRRPKKTRGDTRLDARPWMRLTGSRRRRVRSQAPVKQTQQHGGGPCASDASFDPFFVAIVAETTCLRCGRDVSQPAQAMC